MSKIYADTIETENSNVDITLGAAGDAVLIPTGATLKTNKIFDAGGNNIITSDGSGNLTINSGLGSKEILLSSQTASNSTSISFTSDIDSTYDVYIFRYIEIGPATDQAQFAFQVGSGYNTTVTSSVYRAYNGASGTAFSYLTSGDQGQGTAIQQLSYSTGNDAFSSISGDVWLFNPSSTTFVKHWLSRSTTTGYEPAAIDWHGGGYFNTTSAITQVQFSCSAGNFDGYIKMYGLSST